MKNEIHQYLVDNEERVINFIIKFFKNNYSLRGASDFIKHVFVLEDDFLDLCQYFGHK